MDELVRWLTACLDEDERIAKAATPGPWEQAGERSEWVSSDEYWAVADCSGAEPARENAQHIAAHDPARVLREIDAKRDLLVFAKGIHDHHATFTTGVYARLEKTLRLFALAYAGRVGYREEWRP